MKKIVIALAVTVVIGVALFIIYPENKSVQESDRLTIWCDSIYHQNVVCPKHGQVEIPREVLAKQEADYLTWCDSIYHQNVSCPKHGQVEIPREVLAKQEADHNDWLNRHNNRK